MKLFNLNIGEEGIALWTENDREHMTANQKFFLILVAIVLVGFLYLAHISVWMAFLTVLMVVFFWVFMRIISHSEDE